MLSWLTSPAITQKSPLAEMNVVWVQVGKTQIRVHMYILHMWITSMKRCGLYLYTVFMTLLLCLTACTPMLFVLTKPAAMQSPKGQFVPLCRAVCTYSGSSSLLGWTCPVWVGTSWGTAVRQHTDRMSAAGEGDVRWLSLQLQEKLLHEMCCHSLTSCISGRERGQQQLSSA